MAGFRQHLAAILCLLLLTAQVAASESAEDTAASSRGFEYLPLAPPFVVSYGATGKVGFLKAEVSLRLATAAVPAAKQHMPAIRHELIMLLSRQDAEALGTAERRETLRLAALEALRALLGQTASTRAEDVQDLLFTAFVTQR